MVWKWRRPQRDDDVMNAATVAIIRESVFDRVLKVYQTGEQQ